MTLKITKVDRKLKTITVGASRRGGKKFKGIDSGRALALQATPKIFMPTTTINYNQAVVTYPPNSPAPNYANFNLLLKTLYQTSSFFPVHFSGLYSWNLKSQIENWDNSGATRMEYNDGYIEYIVKRKGKDVSGGYELITSRFTEPQFHKHLQNERITKYLQVWQ